ncbi:hypothetical protein BST28156_02747 [Burkholderia stagnalis]|nr:hypothetical protein BST28156_02747 [Burkholderia stagnalis]
MRRSRKLSIDGCRWSSDAPRRGSRCVTRSSIRDAWLRGLSIGCVDADSATSSQPERSSRRTASSAPNGRVARVHTNANSSPATPARLLFRNTKKSASYALWMLMKVAVLTATSIVTMLNCGLGSSVPTRMNGPAKSSTSIAKSCTCGSTTNRYRPAITTLAQVARKNRNTIGAGSSSAAKKLHETATSVTALAPSCQPELIHSPQAATIAHTTVSVENSIIPRSKKRSVPPSRQCR